jgi:hypothetical protein
MTMGLPPLTGPGTVWDRKIFTPRTLPPTGLDESRARAATSTCPVGIKALKDPEAPVTLAPKAPPAMCTPAVPAIADASTLPLAMPKDPEIGVRIQAWL